MSSLAADLSREPGSSAPPSPTATVLLGRSGAPGVGVGRPLVVESDAESAPSAVRTTDRPTDPAAEAAALRAALETAADELTELARQTTLLAGEEIGSIFVAQALFARDPGIVDPALEQIADGTSAMDAIVAVTSHHADRLAAVDDDYFRERAADVRDIGRRVAGILGGVRRPDLWHPDGRPAVLVAIDLDPSAVATLRRELVAGIALAGGTPTGHAAIVARALGVPLVLGLGAAAVDQLRDAAIVAIDGSAGRVVADPTAVTLAELQAAASDRPPDRTDEPRTDHGIAVMANIASAIEAAAAASAGADGVGLVRTELLFLGRHTPPSVDEQRATYARIRAALGSCPVVFRTLDIGGDKPASWGGGMVEANPALGVRGVRLGLAQPHILDDQLRALVEASPDAELRIMLPMVSTVEEVSAVRTRLDALVEAAASPPTSVQLGVMIEVPAAALVADGLAEVADFFSIGTNDLVQYTLAADRVNPAMADLATALQPAVLRLLASVVKAGHRRHRHVAVCGEAASDPAMIPILVGLGVDELSVTPSAVGRVRDVLDGIDLTACRSLARRAVRATSLTAVRALLEQGTARPR
jgi:multiphosphoryl transfer protein